MRGALRGPEYLLHSYGCTRKFQSTTCSPEPSLWPTPTMWSSEGKQTTRKLGKDELLSTASFPSLCSLRLGQDRQPQRMSSYIPIPATFNSSSKSFLPVTSEDCERDTEKVLERAKSRETLEREAQYSRKWDDRLGFSITLSRKNR